MDFKIHFYIRRHGLRGQSSSVKQYKTDMRRCCLCMLLLLLLLAGLAVAIYFLIKYLDVSNMQYVAVSTTLGVIQGRVVPAPGPNNPKVQAYLGIPFAQPPVGDLRYADPQPLDELPSDPYMADNMQYSCIQYLDKTFGTFAGMEMWNAQNPLREDCLYLNIWVPHQDQADGNTTPKHVMVWIYGGGFYSGSNELWVYDGKALAAYGDVIVASFNYRVGTFGYLSTGDGRIKGNFGMKDQVMALQWIYDNIAAFGGDPNAVTIFGESSGASSAGLHMMSDQADHLFHRAIFQSGSPDSHWSFMTQKQAQTRSQEFFKAVNCTMLETNSLLRCLRALDTDTILSHEWVDLHFMVFPWAPSVDGEYLTDTPYNLLQRGLFQKKDTLLGVNKDEGTFWILFVLENFSKDHESLQNRTMFNAAIDTLAWDLPQHERDKLRQLYAPADPRDLAGHRDVLDKVCGDRSFTCPTKQLTKTYNQAGLNTHFYYLTYRASTEVWPPWMGVIHGAEIQWVFGMALNQSRGYSPQEVEFAKNIMSYWVNFAKSGDPNGPGLAEWPPYQHDSPVYLEMKGPGNMTINTDNLRGGHCRTWDTINQRINEENRWRL